MKVLLENGYHAVFGTKNTPYIIEAKVIRLKEMAVASGAPLKPRLKGAGPQTANPLNRSACRITQEIMLAQKPVEKRVDRSND